MSEEKKVVSGHVGWSQDYKSTADPSTIGGYTRTNEWSREHIEQETAEAIARWLETRSSSFPGQQRLTPDAIRRGDWKPR